MSRITVIGAGATGHALAAILTERGHEVFLTDTEINKEILEDTKAAGKITVDGTHTTTAVLKGVTTDLQAAVESAEIIVSCTISNRDAEIAEAIVPYIKEDQAVLIGAGNGASIIFHKIFAEHQKEEVLIAETAGNFFPARLLGAGKVLIGLPLGPKGIVAFPTERTSEASERFSTVWELNPVGNMIEALFNGPNLICHGAGCILNISAIDRSKGKFNLFTDGLSEGFLKLTDALWEEKRAVYEGYESIPSPAPREFLAGVMDPTVSDYQFFRKMDGPGSLEHRYITEDVPNLLAFFISVARAAEIKVPLFEGILSLVSSITGKDFYATGRTLENLGYGNLSKTELIELFKAK